MKSRRSERSRLPGPPRANAGKSRERPSRALWVCVLVIVEILAWSAASVLVASEAARLAVAVAVGAGLAIAMRDRIWGTDWRAKIANSRARRPS